ncbi:DUF418 domain-containing protein [Paenibacillus polymyxa]|uniref:DUF418 domain-containing protein n=1 Tax=Paenibacillus polymyxa TaxID=1406 RepID=UPI0023F7DA1A|nr:heparan-alpha-glucosaminide N-acetyltransferase domain-containing protein [Paenibacillus polymyxa]
MQENQRRLEGIDLARALALLGMLIINFTELTGASGSGPSLLLKLEWLVEGKASAIFVILAGIGISLMTRRTRESDNSDLINRQKGIIQKRAVFLFGIGLLLYAVGWEYDILHYYGVYLFLCSFLFFRSTRVLWIWFSIVLIIGQLSIIFLGYQITDAEFWSPHGFMANLLFTGYHPVFPWFGFFILGMITGRLQLQNYKVRLFLLSIGFILYSGIGFVSSYMIGLVYKSSTEEDMSLFALFATTSSVPNIAYVLSSSGLSLIVIVFCLYIAEYASRYVRILVLTGQYSLSHYLSQVFIGMTVLGILNRLDEQNLSFTVLYSILFFVFSILLTLIWAKTHQRGPLELAMRKITG